MALAVRFAHQRVLFASLAVSVFLVYREPHHGMNGIGAMLGGHLTALALGLAAAAWRSATFAELSAVLRGDLAGPIFLANLSGGLVVGVAGCAACWRASSGSSRARARTGTPAVR